MYPFSKTYYKIWSKQPLISKNTFDIKQTSVFMYCIFFFKNY